MRLIAALSAAFRRSYQAQGKVSVATTTHPPTFYLQAYLIGRKEGAHRVTSFTMKNHLYGMNKSIGVLCKKTVLIR